MKKRLKTNVNVLMADVSMNDLAIQPISISCLDTEWESGLEQAKASDDYRMKFGKQTRRSQAVLTPFLLLNFFKCICPSETTGLRMLLLFFLLYSILKTK